MNQIIDAGVHPLADGDPPAWASAWGEDRFGIYAAFTLAGVTQRMRWIPPGVFEMGAPEDEPGWKDIESPVHTVTIAYGFWLFDTLCTQAMWEAVTGSNPSAFKSPTRPVDSMTLDEVWAFIETVNQRVDGLDLTLPSEAEWEYACRGATATATYAGPLTVLGESNAPVLDDIAWYGGNSGVNFELESGRDSHNIREQQYPHTKAGSHPVALKRPNRWGIHDALGNVWEWCADTWHDDYDQAPTDGSAWIDPGLEAGTGYVMRGGSWANDAGRVRAAYRGHGDPVGRRDTMGFRCVRVQSAIERERRAPKRP